MGATAMLARCARRRGDLQRAGILWGAAHAEFVRTPTRFDPSFHGAELLDERDPRFTAAFERGRELDLWTAAAIALGELELPQTVPWRASTMRTARLSVVIAAA